LSVYSTAILHDIHCQGGCSTDEHHKSSSHRWCPSRTHRIHGSSLVHFRLVCPVRPTQYNEGTTIYVLQFRYGDWVHDDHRKIRVIFTITGDSTISRYSHGAHTWSSIQQWPSVTENLSQSIPRQWETNKKVKMDNCSHAKPTLSEEGQCESWIVCISSKGSRAGVACNGCPNPTMYIQYTSCLT
jgi:hypothetical protein